MHWYNEPSNWTQDESKNSITVQAVPGTDFWRTTHSGIITDNAHFYYQQQLGDFQAEVKVSGNYAALYDQAGLMLRVNESTWIKCGIEYIASVQHASAVVTREFSDWSVASLAQKNPAALWLSLKRQGITIEIQYSLDGSHYQLLRQAYLTANESMDVGIMCASPIGSGFSVTFEGLKIQST